MKYKYLLGAQLLLTSKPTESRRVLNTIDEVDRERISNRDFPLMENDAIQIIESDQDTKPCVVSGEGGGASNSEEIVPWGIEEVLEDLSFWDGVSVGEGEVKVCVVGSGYDLGHDDLPSNVTGATFSDEEWSVDLDGMGTHTAGIIASIGDNLKGIRGIFPNNSNGKFQLVIGKAVEGSGGGGTLSQMLRAVHGCVIRGAKVITIPVGNECYSKIEEVYFNRIYSEGILIIAAGGDEGDDIYTYPAALSSVIGVASSNQNRERGSSSSNDQIELTAPGSDIVSTIPGNNYASMTGSGMAAAHVSAVAAQLWLHFPSCTNSQIRNVLAKTAFDLGETGCDEIFGHGLIQAKAAYELLNQGNCGGDIGVTVPVGGCGQLNNPLLTTSCLTDADCADDDPCTVDVCTSNVCTNELDCSLCGLSTVVQVDIETDLYPEETSWEILKHDTFERVMAKDKTYGNCERLYSQSKCVPDGNYVFMIYDYEGDGMCCDHGRGKYEVFVGGERKILGREFEERRTHFFSTFENFSNSPTPEEATSYPTYSPTAIGSMEPTATQNCSTDSDCDDDNTCTVDTCVNGFCSRILDCDLCGLTQVTVDLVTDNNPNETSWAITDYRTNRKVMKSYEYETQGSYTQSQCLSRGTYIFAIFDSASDGMCCNSGNGTYALTIVDQTVSAGGMFDTSEMHLFSIGDSPLKIINAGDAATSFEPTTTREPTFSPTATWYPTRTPTDRPSLSLVPSIKPSESQVPSDSPSSLPSISPSLKPSTSPSLEPSFEPSTSPSLEPSLEPSSSPSGKPSSSPSTLPSNVPSVSPSLEPSFEPSISPSLEPSNEPSQVPSDTPSALPSASPSSDPSSLPSGEPSYEPSDIPSSLPSNEPSETPSASPSTLPSDIPSKIPSTSPSVNPSTLPSTSPSSKPSSEPSDAPSSAPSSSPSNNPSSLPSDVPSSEPSSNPSSWPSSEPSSLPSITPSSWPSSQPSRTPSTSPSSNPSSSPSDVPSSEPSSKPSSSPSNKPSSSPSNAPSSSPSSQPSSTPSNSPSSNPSSLPSDAPSSEPSSKPSSWPSSEPSSLPSSIPSTWPSSQPSSTPSISPSSAPSSSPSDVPSFEPSSKPSSSPSSKPSSSPSSAPSSSPSSQPSSTPSSSPSSNPSSSPSYVPSSKPSSKPSSSPSSQPSSSPSSAPSSSPSDVPSYEPSNKPSSSPSSEPSSKPSSSPSTSPSISPSNYPSLVPSSSPSYTPSLMPSSFPSILPSIAPSSAPSQCSDIGIISQECGGWDGSSPVCCSGLVCDFNDKRCKYTCGMEDDPSKSCGDSGAFHDECCEGYTCHYGYQKCMPFDPETAVCAAAGTGAQECGAIWNSKYFCCDGLQCNELKCVSTDTDSPTTQPTDGPSQCGVNDDFSKECGSEWALALPVCCPGLVCDYTAKQCKSKCGLEEMPAKSCGNSEAFADECCEGYTCHYGVKKCRPYDPAICGSDGQKAQECGANWAGNYFCCDGLQCKDDGSLECGLPPAPSPTSKPASSPTSEPTPSPTSKPTSSPTSEPASSSTSEPTPSPTSKPASSSTSKPTSSSTSKPTLSPTNPPTSSPTNPPTCGQIGQISQQCGGWSGSVPTCCSGLICNDNKRCAACGVSGEKSQQCGATGGAFACCDGLVCNEGRKECMTYQCTKTGRAQTCGAAYSINYECCPGYKCSDTDTNCLPV